MKKLLWTALCRIIAGWILPFPGSPALAQWGGVDGSFIPGFDQDVFSIAVQPDGKLLVTGFFTKVGSTSRNGVARLNSNGSLDTTFNPGAGAFNTSLNQQGTVETLALEEDGRVVVGGIFQLFNNAPHNYIARLNSDGSLDTTYNPSPDDQVVTLALQPDRKLLIGGAFATVNGMPRSYLARLNTNGSLDANFIPGIGTGPNKGVQAIALQADGRIVIGGQFTSFSGASRVRVARLNVDGTLDNTFNSGTGPDMAVLTMSPQADGKVVIGGDFTSVAGSPRHYVARLNSDGLLDTSFQPNIALTFGGVLAVQTEVDGKVLVGGDYTTVDGVSRINLARLKTDGTLDTNFDTGSGPSMAGRRDPYPRVRGLAIQADGKVLVGGGFTKFNGVSLNFMARLLGDQGGAVEFTNTSFIADENDGYASITVQRTGSTNGTVSVNYLTRDATATAGTDYAAQAGVLTFGPGETNQVFTVPIIPDSQVEPNETVNLVLANPIGGVILGSQKTARLTIVDNTNSVPITFTSITNFSADQVRLTLSGQGGRTYVLQAATSLPYWVSIQTNTASSDTFQFIDDGVTTSRQRFYRAFSQ